MKESVAALGTFDGLHVGHMKVIEKAVSLSKEMSLTPVVTFFDVHPRTLIDSSSPMKLISDSHRDSIVASLGADKKIFEFEKIVNLSAERFFYDILINGLNCKAICCGENYRFGKGAAGDVGFLKNECEKNGITLCVSDMIKIDGNEVSSTRIRSFIQQGEIEKANRMLGRYFSFSSPVIDGKHLGRKLGIPTINQIIDKELVKPGNGVYASLTTVDGKKYKSITNIGVRPTVENTLKTNSETHILGFSGNLYGSNPTVELVSFIRGEQKFSSVALLKEQIERDINKRKLLESE